MMYLKYMIFVSCLMSSSSSSILLSNAATFQVVGPSGSGKTYFTCQLMQNAEYLFENVINRIFWLMGSEDGESGETAQILKEIQKEVIFMNGFQKGWQRFLERGDAIVIDDLFIESTKEKDFNNLFTKIARHRGVTVIFLTQNLFHQGGQHRTRNLNVHYLVLFKNPRDVTVIDFIARQAFHANKKFLIDSYHDATDNKPYGYLFLDFTQSCPEELRVRTDIFNDEGPTIYKQL